MSGSSWKISKLIIKSPMEDNKNFLYERIYWGLILPKKMEYQNTYPTWLSRCYFYDAREMDSSPEMGRVPLVEFFVV